MVRKTSLDELSRNNSEHLSAHDLLRYSNQELTGLLKTLKLQQMDVEDIRFDVFDQIYSMIIDNIDLRIKLNKMSGRILSQASLNVDKTVANYFRKNHHTQTGLNNLETAKFRAKLLEQKNRSLAK